MKFSIKTLRGQTRTLGVQDLLGLFGDKINDEIIIGDDTYRISTAQSIMIVVSQTADPSGMRK